MNINTFEKLHELIIADQLKKKWPRDYKQHYLDDQETLAEPVMLAEINDLYERFRTARAKINTRNKTGELLENYISIK